MKRIAFASPIPAAVSGGTEPSPAYTYQAVTEHFDKVLRHAGRDQGVKRLMLSRFDKKAIGLPPTNGLLRPRVNRAKEAVMGLVIAAAMMFLSGEARATQAAVNLGTAGNYVILTKSGISTVPSSAITGDIAVSPIKASAITGFSLVYFTGNQYATSAQITGKAYAADYGAPTPSILTTAIGDMQTAYNDAAGRTLPNFTELAAGQIGGLTLTPGLYKWSSDVLISSDVTLSGSASDVWIFQIAGKITQATGTKVFLAGGAMAKNIFWQAFGDVSLGTGAHFEGIIMAQTSISLGTGATMNGRLLAQTAVTLESNTVSTPAAAAAASTLVSSAVLAGPYVDTIGQSLDVGTKTLTAPQSGSTQFYRIRSSTALTIGRIVVSGGNVAITYK